MAPESNAEAAGSSSNKSPSRAKGSSVRDSMDTHPLTTNPKKRKLRKSRRSLANEIDGLFQSSGEKAREEITSYTLRMHEMFPSNVGAENISSLLDNFDRERAVESNDPVSFDDAISRVRQDIQSLIDDTAGKGLYEHFFSPLPDTDALCQPGRITLKELEAQWMSRWVAPPDGSKRGMDECSKLIGFIGEYLVSTPRHNVLTW